MTSDEELVARATAGDQEAFGQLVARWERPIYALAYRTLRREEEARDVVQDAFLRAYRGLKGFKGEAKFSSWLYRITLNLCRDWMRKERRAPVAQVPEGTDPLDLADQQAAPTESVEDLVARREMSAAVQLAMAELPEEQRVAIMLKEYQGLTFQEIAEMLDCPLSTVKTRLYQGLTVLRRRLERQQAEATELRRATWQSTSQVR
jgi:RNA polymerase sigma-70 factor, ECF subfamily